MVNSVIHHIALDLNPLITQWMQGVSTREARSAVERLGLEHERIESFIVRRSAMEVSPAPSEVLPAVEVKDIKAEPSPDAMSNASGDSSVSTSDFKVKQEEPMEGEEQFFDAPNGQPDPVPEEPLDPVVYGSETWHEAVPREWVPVITRDLGRQRRQPEQGAFSEAYMNGLPKKKRRTEQ